MKLMLFVALIQSRFWNKSEKIKWCYRGIIAKYFPLDSIRLLNIIFDIINSGSISIVCECTEASRQSNSFLRIIDTKENKK